MGEGGSEDMKTISPEEQYKVDNYFIKIEQHKECDPEHGVFYGGELWAHVKKCEANIPEPKLRMKR